MSRIVRRMRFLRNWEAVNVVFLPALFVWVWTEGQNPVGWGWRIPPLVMSSFLLAQGTLYWHLKLRTIRYRVAWPRWFPRRFRSFRRVNVLFLVGWAGAIVAGFLSGWDLPDAAWSIGLWAFVAAEHVNYYEYQLMHDTKADLAYLARNRRLRRSPLASDLARSADRGGGSASPDVPPFRRR